MDLHTLSPDTQATLLLTSRLRQSGQGAPTPLRSSEYLNLIKALRGMELQPGDLFEESNQRRLSDVGAIHSEHMTALLARGLVLAMALEKWASQGIWVIGWNDPEYPANYKERLKGQAPPILYGIGDTALLSAGGVAIVGSRDVNEHGITFARRVASACAAHGYRLSRAALEVWIVRQCWRALITAETLWEFFRIAWLVTRCLAGLEMPSWVDLWFLYRLSSQRHASLLPMQWRETSSYMRSQSSRW